MWRDSGRDDMPKDSAWNLVDYLVDLAARLRKRGGHSYASPDLSTIKATASYVIGGIYAPYTAGDANIAIDEDGEVYKVVSSASATDVGLGVTVAQNPVMHRDKVIVVAGGGATAPKKVMSSAGTLSVSALSGSPPPAVYATVFKDRTVMAYSTSADATGHKMVERVWFSDPGNPESWDTVNTYWDFSNPVTGLAAIQNVLLVFHKGYVSRLRGSIPPPKSDFQADDPKWTVGCADARSIAYWGENVIWASAEGIYLTDGALYDDVTQQAGMKTYWQETLASYSAATYTIAGGVIRDDYWYSVMNGSSFVDAGSINLPSRSWVRHSNIDAVAMWVAQGVTDELYFGRRGAARVGKLSSVYMPDASVKNDANGTAVTPILETPFYKDRPGKKRWWRFYLAYDLRDAASDNPTLTASYITSPEATSYTSVTGLDGNAAPLAKTTEYTRQRRFLNKAANGMAFKFAQSGASSDTRIYELEAEVHSREQSRV